MLRAIIELLKTTNLNTEDIKMAKGKYKYPENWKEFKNYIKTR